MGFRLHREVEDNALFAQDGDDDKAACPHCGCDEVRMDKEQNPICAECKSPLFERDEDEDEDDPEEGARDDFDDYLEEVEREMGDGDE